MKKLSIMAALVATIGINGIADAGNLDIGARYGESVEERGGNLELAIRYFPIPLISLTGTAGYADLHYDKKLYAKKAEVVPVGGFINAHLPLIPFVKPYAGIGGVVYSINDTTSSNPADKDDERTGTSTVQAGIDISLPVPLLSINIEARRLLDDHQTLVFTGAWLRF